MRAVLEQLRAGLEAGGYAFAGGAAGLPDVATVRAALHEGGLDPSDDLVEWFAWVGARGALAEVIPAWAPLGFGDAVGLRAQLLQVQEQVAGAQAAAASPYASVVPLLAEVVGGGDLIAVAERGRGPVVLVSQVGWHDGVPVMFDSVESMVRTLVASWRSGGHRPGADGAVLAEAAPVEKAWRAANPVAVAAGSVLPRELVDGAVPEEPPARPGGLLSRLRGRSRKRGPEDLLAIWRDPAADGDAQMAALDALVERFPDVARVELLADLDHPRRMLHAVGRLADLGSPAALEPALRLLRTGEPRRRITAISALRRLGGPDVVPPLLDACRDPMPGVAAEAVQALGLLGAREQLPVVRDLPDRGNAHLRTMIDQTVRLLSD